MVDMIDWCLIHQFNYQIRAMSIQKIAMLIKSLNIITGIGLIVIGVLSILNIANILSFKIFLIPSPFFIAFFGVCIIGAELKVKLILKKLAFLQTLIGRGLFNVFLSSIAFWFLQFSEVLAWVAALILFIIGIIYIAFDCGYGKELKKQYEKEDAKREQPETVKNGRENLI